ncbi:hypothetical protein BC831DRAFT_93770 [Entophlyctis helioformis]|nr:hypothetical protein BC831DRAFT_93770 [Entophlyctis helioformis]
MASSHVQGVTSIPSSHLPHSFIESGSPHDRPNKPLYSPFSGLLQLAAMSVVGRILAAWILQPQLPSSGAGFAAGLLETLVGILANTALFALLGIGFGAPLEWTDLTLAGSLFVGALLPPSCALTLYRMVASTSNRTASLARWPHSADGRISLNAGVWRFVFAFVGAWIGAFILPLDWQKDYQKYPLPPLFGLLVGQMAFFIVNAAAPRLLPSSLGLV